MNFTVDHKERLEKLYDFNAIKCVLVTNNLITKSSLGIPFSFTGHMKNIPDVIKDFYRKILVEFNQEINLNDLDLTFGELIQRGVLVIDIHYLESSFLDHLKKKFLQKPFFQFGEFESNFNFEKQFSLPICLNKNEVFKYINNYLHENNINEINWLALKHTSDEDFKYFQNSLQYFDISIDFKNFLLLTFKQKFSLLKKLSFDTDFLRLMCGVCFNFYDLSILCIDKFGIFDVCKSCNLLHFKCKECFENSNSTCLLNSNKLLKFETCIFKKYFNFLISLSLEPTLCAYYSCCSHVQMCFAFKSDGQNKMLTHEYASRLTTDQLRAPLNLLFKKIKNINENTSIFQISAAEEPKNALKRYFEIDEQFETLLNIN